MLYCLRKVNNSVWHLVSSYKPLPVYVKYWNLYNYLTPWSRTLFEKMIVAQLIKDYNVLIKPEWSLSWSKDHALNPVLSQSCLVHILTTYLTSISSWTSHLRARQISPSSLLPSSFASKILYLFSFPTGIPHDHTTLQNVESLHCAVFQILLLLPSYHLIKKIPLKSLFSDALGPCLPSGPSHKVSRPCKTMHTGSLLYFNIKMFT
jgi:hypothetical protein